MSGQKWWQMNIRVGIYVTYLGKNNLKHTYLGMNLELAITAQSGDLSLIHDRPQKLFNVQ